MNWATVAGPLSSSLSRIQVRKLSVFVLATKHHPPNYAIIASWPSVELHQLKKGSISALSMLLVCPRCSGSLQPDAHACPRCGLVLTNLSNEVGEAPQTTSPNGREPYSDLYPTPETVTQPGHLEQV